MAGLEFMGELPFTTVYLHGTVRDTQHRKMSKSLGNGIDPLDVVERFGADALRYTIIAGMAVGTDLILDPEDLEASFAPGRNFANKIWNAGRFLLSNLDGPVRPLAGQRPGVIRREELTLADRWIIARCEATVLEATLAYERFRLNDAAAVVYHFLWSDLADWYIEQIKPRLYGDQPGGDVARAVAQRTFEVALQLLHPVMPFITETLWRRFPGRAPGGHADHLALAGERPPRRRPRSASRFRPGPGAGRRHPDHPRRVRHPARPAGAGLGLGPPRGVRKRAGDDPAPGPHRTDRVWPASPRARWQRRAVRRHHRLRPAR